MPTPTPDPAAAPPADAAAAAAVAAAAAGHAALLAQLQRPGALAGWRGEVRLVQTHISSLLMAGDRVYKLKRPVNFGFLDFSTLAARQAACDDELRLNRRTAPDLYLAVLPVLARRPSGAANGLTEAHIPGSANAADTATASVSVSVSVSDSDANAAAHPAPPPSAPEAVVDWAVQMRRFEADQGFDRLADAGRLQPAQVDALAQALADFHACLPPAPACYGQPDQTRAWARTNLSELAALVAGDAALSARIGHLARWTEARGAALAPLMAQRQQQGRVREVHGDLHLGNVVWQDGAPLLFDALEFSAPMRHTDTAGDLAFMAMDLMAHGQPGLASRFVNAVLDASGDHDVLPLLPWWMLYRALVRAKVARLSAPSQAAQAERYLQVAEALAGAGPRPAAPQLVQMMGLSGSGKSAVAGALAEHLGGVRLRADVLRKRLFGLAPAERADPSVGLYSLEANRLTYQRLLDLAALALDTGRTAVVDAASLRRDERAAFTALARRAGARYTLALCTAPEPVLVARVAARAATGQDASDATPAVLARQQELVQWPGPDEAASTQVIDTDAPRPQVAERACGLFGVDAR